MIDNPIINVITRTSGRPNYFKKNRDALLSQTYKNYRHIVSVDDKESEEYASGNCDILIVNDRKELYRENIDNVDEKKGKFFPHNLYMNACNESISEGWVMYVDDDDMFIDNNALQRVASVIKNTDEDTLILFRMKYGSTNDKYNDEHSVPSIVNKFNPPKIGNIGTPCFCVNIKWVEYMKWDMYSCSDYRVITRLFKNVPKFIFFPSDITLIGHNGGGERVDI